MSCTHYRTAEYQALCTECRLTKEPEYFVEGVLTSPVPHNPSRIPQPIEDATGFPFDDNTAGEELRVSCRFCGEEVRSDHPGDVCTRCIVDNVTTPKANPLGGHPDFYKILDEMKALYSAKHYQYATDADPMINFRLCGKLMHKLFKPGINPTIAAALTLMSKQIVGVYEIVGEGKTNTIESLQDKLRDIGIYSVILQILVAEALTETK